MKTIGLAVTIAKQFGPTTVLVGRTQTENENEIEMEITTTAKEVEVPQERISSIRTYLDKWNTDLLYSAMCKYNHKKPIKLRMNSLELVSGFMEIDTTVKPPTAWAMLYLVANGTKVLLKLNYNALENDSTEVGHYILTTHNMMSKLMARGIKYWIQRSEALPDELI